MAVVNILSRWTIPVFIAVVILVGWRRKVPVYEAFIDGAKEGLETVAVIFPYLLAVLVALGLARSSGMLDMISAFVGPWTQRLGIPPEILPLGLIRPLSGSGAQAAMFDLIQTYGADSYLGRLAATIQGSTETTLYILSAYFGSVGVKKVRHALGAGLLADLAGFLAAVVICGILFL